MRNKLTPLRWSEWLARARSHGVVPQGCPLLFRGLFPVLLTMLSFAALACVQTRELPAAEAALKEKNTRLYPATNRILDGVYRSEPTSVDVDPLHAYGVEKYQLKELFVTFFSDGRFFEAQPDYGLLGFDADREIRREPTGWGTYEFSGNRGRAIFYRQPGEEGPPSIWGLLLRGDGGVVVIGDTRSQYTSESGILYNLLDRCDGLRLEGTFLRGDYKTFQPGSSNIPTDAVTFTRDGRFADRGFVDATGVLWRTPDGGFAEDDGVPGTGTYRIANYTLELRYSDGRVKPIFFYLEPGTSKANVREFYANTWKFVRID